MVQFHTRQLVCIAGYFLNFSFDISWIMYALIKLSIGRFKLVASRISNMFQRYKDL